MASFTPTKQSEPHIAVKLGESISANDMAMIISPAPKNGIESVNQLRLCEAARGFANGFYFVLDHPERTSARSDLYLAEMTVSASMLPDGLTQKVKAFADVGYLGLLLRELNASQFQEVVYLWDDIVPQYCLAGCRDDEVIRISHKVDVVGAAKP